MGQPGGAIALAYHRIGSSARDPFLLCTPPEQFAAHLAVVQRLARIVPLAELADPDPTPRVAITLDDGYADTLHGAVPVLEAANAPATAFLCTDTLEHPRAYWWDRLAALVYRAPMTRTRKTLTVSGTAIPLRLWRRRSRFFTISDLHRALRPLPVAQIDEHLDELDALIGDGSSAVVGSAHRYEVPPRLTRDEVRMLAAHPWIEIGGHTRTHSWLASLSPQQQLTEIRGCREALGAILDADVEAFAYPFGQPESFTAETPQIVHDAGFRRAWTLSWGGVEPGTDPMELPRHSVGKLSAAEFASRLRGWLGLDHAANPPP